MPPVTAVPPRGGDLPGVRAVPGWTGRAAWGMTRAAISASVPGSMTAIQARVLPTAGPAAIIAAVLDLFGTATPRR
jgi:hypothetical protein